MKITKVTARNIMFTEPMVWNGQSINLNLGLILGNKRNYIIDTGLGSGSIEPILKYIANDYKPIVVINTHHDFDHIWGNWVFKNSLIIAHKICADLQKNDWDNGIRRHSELANGEVRKCMPNIVFEKSMYFPDDGIEIFHSPGHTAGCISIYDTIDKVLHVGDNIGDSDEELVPHIDTDITIFKRLIEVYKQYNFNFCLSGHHEPQKKEVLTRMEKALPEAWKKQKNG
ncbi:MAG: MBL fold metallo-hydrolase [Defluviitaleaceae bacterium]|nr:MBL fold metallo-hydrolase [Defluviitaleaceae bacterium]